MIHMMTKWMMIFITIINAMKIIMIRIALPTWEVVISDRISGTFVKVRPGYNLVLKISDDDRATLRRRYFLDSMKGRKGYPKRRRPQKGMKE